MCSKTDYTTENLILQTYQNFKMTVGELIQILKLMPENSDVIVAISTGYNDLEIKENKSVDFIGENILVAKINNFQVAIHSELNVIEKDRKIYEEK